jgi:hypothetical protein
MDIPSKERQPRPSQQIQSPARRTGLLPDRGPRLQRDLLPPFFFLIIRFIAFWGRALCKTVGTFSVLHVAHLAFRPLSLLVLFGLGPECVCACVGGVCLPRCCWFFILIPHLFSFSLLYSVGGDKSPCVFSNRLMSCMYLNRCFVALCPPNSVLIDLAPLFSFFSIFFLCLLKAGHRKR